MSTQVVADNVKPAGVESVPGFLFFDHVAIAVKQGELEAQVNAYKLLGFKELHREDVLGKDLVREVLLQVGDGPNLVRNANMAFLGLFSFRRIRHSNPTLQESNNA